MKKTFSLILSLALLMSSFSAITVHAADASSYFKEEEAFFFSFENKSDLDEPDMQFDNGSDGTFQTAGAATYFTPGANGSAGAVAVHTEVKEGNQGIQNSGVNNIKLIPGKDYEISMNIKLLSAYNYAICPNVNFFIMTQNTKTYSNAACTEGESSTGSYYSVFKVKGDSVFTKNSDGTISDEWSTLKATFTVPTQFSSNRFVKAGELSNFQIFARFGSSEHSIDTASDFTSEFYATREDVTVRVTNGKPEIRKNVWIEYALDDICLLPAAYTSESVDPEPEPEPRELAFWDQDFESGKLGTGEDGLLYEAMSYTPEFTDDTPEELPDSTKALKAVYKDSADGLLDLKIKTGDNSKKLWYNRTYKVSFWAKTSQAVVDYAKNTGKSMHFIQERTSEQRLERRKDKWPNMELKVEYDTNWKYYEIYYRETLNESLSRSSENDGWTTIFDFRFKLPGNRSDSPATDADGDKTYTYKTLAGESVTEKAKNFEIYLDDFKVEPTNIVYNGDMAIAEAADSTIPFLHYDGRTKNNGQDYYLAGSDTFSPAVLGDGTITADNTFAEVSGIANENVLKLTEADDKMHQEVEIDNKKKYTVSFWAKADDGAAVGKNLLPVMDRSIIGDMRDDTTIEITPKDNSAKVSINDPANPDYNLGMGYGNTTGETGDVPFMLFSGPMGNSHSSTTLNLTAAGEKIVKDDYFTRLKADPATAWNYEYYNGESWVSTNNQDEFSSNLALTEGWKEYTFDYECNYEGDHYRMPEFSIDTDEAVNFSLANISIVEQESGEEPVTPPPADTPSEFKASNVSATSSKESLTTSDSINVSWDFEMESGKDTQEADGKSFIKIYANDGANRYFVAAARADAAGRADIKATQDLFGKNLEFEVIPVDKNGNCGHSGTAVFSGKITLAMTSDLAIDLNKTSVNWSVNVTAAETGAASAYIAQYDANNKLVKIDLEPISYTDGEKTFGSNINVLDSAVKVKLMVWSDTFTPLASVKTVELMPVNKDPFAGDDQINVVFLGDSLYAGAGAGSEENKWVTKVSKWFEQTYATDNVKVTCTNKGVGGTTTEYSLVRVLRDVVALEPDVVFFSHTINDGSRDTRRNMESVVRTLMEMDNPPYIIFTRSTNQNLTQSNGYGNQVADFYNLPLIDDLEAYKAVLAETGKPASDFFSDGTHPNAAGYQIIVDEVIRCIESGRYYHRPVVRSDKLMENSGTIAEVNFISATDSSVVKLNGNWSTGSNYVHSTTVGDTMTINFTGDIFAFEYGLHNDAGNIEVRVDGNLVKTFDVHYNGQTGYQRVCKDNSALFDLDYGEHTVELKMVPGPNSSGGNIQNRFFTIMTGSWVQE
ncbi:SGNH/GDSL hydrolase family protein [Congzhengia sp.]|uniref:SGNH/GDSL hydrolase family protein n=1 Tax=Congzhengia sp. TaxID=2944168 RepID=UPI003077AF76